MDYQLIPVHRSITKVDDFDVELRSPADMTGLRYQTVHKEFRGDCIYQSDLDLHFPHLTVAQTLNFAARARPQATIEGLKARRALATAKVEATAAALRLTTALDVKVGNDIVSGASGGERRRTSILENLVGRDSSLQCWDNSTKGLDSTSALKFVQILRENTKATGSIALLTLYPASNQIYDMFDKVLVVSNGQQIYFGKADAAKAYFRDLGFNSADRTLTCDFLTSVSGLSSHRSKDPTSDQKNSRTSADLEGTWRCSVQRAELLKDVEQFLARYRLSQDEKIGDPKKERAFLQNLSPFGSNYIISYPQQIYICLLRAYQRLLNDLGPPIFALIGNAIISVVLGSMFYNLPSDSDSFFAREVLIFFVLLNSTFLGAFEGVQLWEQRPITNKHADYAFYHPSTEALASIICEMPNKILLTCSLNVPVYLLAHLRRTSKAVFTFLLFAFSCLLTGSMLFRAIGTISKELTSSIAPGAAFILLLIIYLGFVLPIPDMPPWLGWFRYLNPIGYAFESLMVNEFADREFPCADLVPRGPVYDGQGGRKCAVAGSNSASGLISGERYIESKYHFHKENLWRNLGLVFLFMIALCGLHLFAADHVRFQNAGNRALRLWTKKKRTPITNLDEENKPEIHRKRSIYNSKEKVPITHNTEVRPPEIRDKNGKEGSLVWKNICYDVKTKGGFKRILDDIEGWIRPGSLTALMGASGAGSS